MMDLINGGFELGGAVFLSMNVFRLFRDKIVRGVHWAATSYFFAWGLWNLIYYPHLEQWWSVAGGACIVAVNFVWLGQIMYYNWRERRGEEWNPRAHVELRRGSWVVDNLKRHRDGS